MKRPSFQFYPGDWSGNSNLRRCTHAEKGAWLDIMCLMHDQEEYGVLRWSLKEIAQAIGCPAALLNGLIAKGVLKGSEEALGEAFVYTPRSGRKDGEPVTLVPTQAGPIWYSSRMVKDEHVRTIRGESSRFSADNGGAPKSAPKTPFGDGSSSSSSSSRKEKEHPPTPRKRGGSFDAAQIELPDWLDAEDWRAWVADRKARKKPVTEDGARRQLQQLDAYRREGHTPADVIAHSIAGGYQGLFPPRAQARASPPSRGQAMADWNAELTRELQGGRNTVIDMGTIDATH